MPFVLSVAPNARPFQSFLDEMLASEALQNRIAENINRTVSSAVAEPSLDEAIRKMVDQTAADPLFYQALRGRHHSRNGPKLGVSNHSVMEASTFLVGCLLSLYGPPRIRR